MTLNDALTSISAQSRLMKELHLYSHSQGVNVGIYGIKQSISAHDAMKKAHLQTSIASLMTQIRHHLKDVISANSNMRMKVINGLFKITIEGTELGLCAYTKPVLFHTLENTQEMLERLIRFYAIFPDKETEKAWHLAQSVVACHASTSERAALKRVAILNPMIPLDTEILADFLDNHLTPFDPFTNRVKGKTISLPCPRGSEIVRHLLKDKK